MSLPDRGAAPDAGNMQATLNTQPGKPVLDVPVGPIMSINTMGETRLFSGLPDLGEPTGCTRVG
tara:strand:- start:484 stop:675 length:192 start_codon:yes stop_codon:yes gene_type:complete